VNIFTVKYFATIAAMSLFYYVTYKLVLLKDKRLGVLYYVLALLAVLFTVIEIFIKKGYLDVSEERPFTSFFVNNGFSLLHCSTIRVHMAL
jgi:hypothetical protein